MLRELPGTPYLRASVGAWNDEADLERLLAALGVGARRRPARAARPGGAERPSLDPRAS